MAVFRLVGLRKNQRTGMWEYRRVIPKHLRPYHSGHEFKRSTGTDSKKDAERRALSFIAQFKALQETLESRYRADQETAASSPPAESTRALELSPEDLRGIAGQLAQALLAKHAAEPAPSEAFSANSAVAPPVPGTPAPQWGSQADPWAGQRMMLIAPKNYGVPATEVSLVTRPLKALLEARGITVVEGQWGTLCELTRNALIGAYAILRQRAKGSDVWTEEKLAERFGGGGGEGVPAGSPKVTFKSLLDGLERERGLRSNTIKAYRRHVGSFAKFLKHDDASRVTVDDVVRWKDHLITSGKVSAKTINEGRLAALSSVLGWGKDNRKLTINAALGIRVRAKKKPRTREKDLREEEAKIILRASLKAGSLEEQLARRHKAARRWIPWLCCYSGARVTEIAQLRGSDVQQEEGHWFMLLSPEAGSIKSDEFRRVPLHPHIIEQGFIEFVRAAGKGPLFYDPKRARVGKADKPQANTVGHKLAEWVREIGVDDPQVAPNHGWRHRFITACRKAGIDAEARSAITGHATKTVGESYGRWPMAALTREVEKLPRIDPSCTKL